jgi:PAS domain S-box-containing protein
MIAAAFASGREAGGRPLLPEAVHGAARQRHLAAVVIVITGVAVRLVFLQGLGNSAPYVTFYPAVIIAALYGGLRSGLLATVLSAVLADYYLIHPSGFGIENPADWLGMAVFLLSGAMISWITGTMLRARARANEAEMQARLAAERELGAAALRESEERFRILADAAFEGIAITEDGRFTDVNDQFARMLGYEPDELRGREVSILLPAEDRERVVAGIHAGAESHIEHAMMRRDGRLITVEAHGRNTTYRDRSVRITAVRDISERRRAEERLQSERDLLQAVMNGAKNSHLVYLDRDFNFVRVNETYARTCGYPPEEMIGRNHFDLYPNADNEAIFSRVRDTGESFEVRDKAFEFPDQPERGVTYWDWSLTPVKGHDDRVAGLVFSLFETTERKRAQETLRLTQSDLEKRVAERTGELARTVEVLQTEIVERRKLEQQLLQSQKLESIGLLAGGVAHDFNNLMTAVSGYGQIIRDKIDPGDELLTSCVEQLLGAADRATELTKSLLAFGRKQIINPKPSLVNDIIVNVVKLLRRIVGEDIDIQTQLAVRSPLVLVDQGQIDQVLVNLAANARDAMPNGGTILVRTDVADVGQEAAGKLGLGNAGPYAVIAVTDDGAGMDAGTRERIFEPFFTTKEAGKGTGLGLSIIYGIIKQHNGTVAVESEVGQGSTFTIYLPLLRAETCEDEQDDESIPESGSETILLAEDEAIVRQLLAEVLQLAGYTVIPARNGEEAVELFREHRQEIALVVSDVVMPRKNGKEVFDAISGIAPGMKFIFMSGYAGEIIHRKGVLDESLDYLAKPIGKDDLLRKVREVLDR